MTARRPWWALAVLGTLLATAAPAEAALRFRDCDRGAFRCAKLAVPLDHGGQAKGRIALRVLRARATGRRRGVVVLLAGGPGQSAVAAYADGGLGDLGALRRTHDLIVFDQRGSGGSGLLRCPELERANILRAAAPAARCATALGPRRQFYASRDTADDMEALRRRLDIPKLSLYGVSYGTRTATSYALRHPTRVDRMVLDSVVEPDGGDAFSQDSFRAVPRVLNRLCAGRRCDAFTRDPVADVAELTRRIAAGGPLRGRLPDRRGRPRPASIARYDVFSSLVSGDFEPALREQYPAAVKAALAGDPAPLLRLERRSIALESGGFEPRELSTALYAATTCAEARLPWPRSAPAAQRRPLAAGAAAQLAPALVAPFDPATALGGDVLDLCSQWPPTGRDPVPGPGPLPPVPTLLIEGENDLRTPLETAREVAAALPGSKVVTVTNAGHSPAQITRCSRRLAPRFLGGRPVPEVCRAAPLPAPSGVPPATLAGLSPVRAVGLTLADMDDDLRRFVPGTSGVGLRSGRYSLASDAGSLVLRGFSFVPGLRVSGRIASFDNERRRRGTLKVAGPRAFRGTVRLRGSRLTGRLGGRRVRAAQAIRPAPTVSPEASSIRMKLPVSRLRP